MRRHGVFLITAVDHLRARKLGEMIRRGVVEADHPMLDQLQGRHRRDGLGVRVW